jgi:uncharacterized surface protein with fasciclin (FAS1) repeats
MADLVGALKGGIFTVFAPTDAAFAALPAGVLDALLADVELLKEVLLYHVSMGEASEMFFDGQVIVSLEGDPITVSVTADDTIGVLNGGGATVDSSNAVVTLNGLIYVIDEVLLPPGFSITDLLNPPVDTPSSAPSPAPASSAWSRSSANSMVVLVLATLWCDFL